MELNSDSTEIIIRQVNSETDARIACNSVREIAKKLEFNKVDNENIIIAAKELTSNLVVHGTVNGSLTVSEIRENDSIGIALVSFDQGPGIKSIPDAMEDNYSTAGSMGCGLGAVRRLMDEFLINSQVTEKQKTYNPHINYAAGGTIIVAIKWLKKPEVRTNSFRWGGISRPMHGYVENGDAFFLNETDDIINVVVVDGLGHGPYAQQASKTAISIVKNNLHLSFEHLFSILHEGLKGTRGAAVTAVRIDKVNQEFSHCGIGNVETRIFPNLLNSPITRSAVVGSGKLPPLLVRKFPWRKNSMLIINSDGISNRWSDDKYIIREISHNPIMVSQYLLRDFGRSNDDATALVIKEGIDNVA